MTSIAIFIYGWFIDRQKLVELYGTKDFESYMDKISNHADVIQIYRAYDSSDPDDYPYYMYLSYIDTQSLVSSDMCPTEEIPTDKFAILRGLDKCHNKFINLDKKIKLVLENKLLINLKNPKVYIDYYDMDRMYVDRGVWISGI